MRRVAVFVDAGYFWVQAVNIIHGRKQDRVTIALDYEKLRTSMLAQTAAHFPDVHLLRIYWYDGPAASGRNPSHDHIQNLDDFKLRLGTRNNAGDQKAVDGLIIADMIGLAQTKAITDALLVSGDADLTPGVTAAQALGIRVHLLSLGPPQATSPHLRAEVDRKTLWEDAEIRTFASAATPSYAARAKPATMTGETSSAITVNDENGGAIASALQKAGLPAPIATVDLLTQACDTYVASLDSTQRSLIDPKSPRLDPQIDRKLLEHGRKAVGRSLEEGEKRELRQTFKSRF